MKESQPKKDRPNINEMKAEDLTMFKAAVGLGRFDIANRIIKKFLEKSLTTIKK